MNETLEIFQDMIRARVVDQLTPVDQLTFMAKHFYDNCVHRQILDPSQVPWEVFRAGCGL